MTYFDLGRLYRSVRYGIAKDLGEHVVDLEILAGPIAREVSRLPPVCKRPCSFLCPWVARYFATLPRD